MSNYSIQEVKLNEITTGDNSRIEIKKEDLSELMESIKQRGLLQDIGIYKLPKAKAGKKYKVIFGNRRLAAFKKLRRKTISAKVFTEEHNAVDLICMNLVENIQRKDIDSFELGRSYCYLADKFEYTPSEIAALLNISQSRVKSCMEIFRSVPEEYSGKIKTMAFGYSRKKGEDIPSTTAKAIANMRRKYSLKKPQVKQLMDQAAKDHSLNAQKLNKVMYFMSRGATLPKAMKKVEDVLIKRYEVSIDKKQVDKLKEKYGNLNNAVHSIIYSSGEIVDPTR